MRASHSFIAMQNLKRFALRQSCGIRQGSLLAMMTALIMFAPYVQATGLDDARARQEVMALAEAEVLEDAKAQTFSKLAHTPWGKVSCLPVIDIPAKVHIVSTYDGGEWVDENAYSRGHPLLYVDVKVKKTDDPIVVVTSGFEPIIWRFDVEEGAQLAGVLLGGFYPQFAIGLPDGVSIGRLAKAGKRNMEIPDCEFAGLAEVEKLAVDHIFKFRHFGYIKQLSSVGLLTDIIEMIGNVEIISLQAKYGGDYPGAKLSFDIPGEAE